MKKLMLVSLIGVVSTFWTGCNSVAPGPLTSNPVNLNPLGHNSFNPPLFNGMAITLAFSQVRSFGTLDVVGPGVNLHIAKNMPPGYVDQPVTPLTADEVTVVEHAFIADTVYGMRNDHSSWDVILVPAIGWSVTLHTAYPPSVLNTNALITVTNITTTAPIVIPGTTNSAAALLQLK